MDFRPVVFVIGILLAILAIMMSIPATIDYFAGHQDWEVFTLSASITLFAGVGMALTSYSKGPKLSIRQAFIMTTASWVSLVFFASIPFYFSQLDLSFTDSMFESMSGLTTTGSTVITNLDLQPSGILIWRALLQWLGGIGIIVMAISILPMLKVGGMQLFRIESSDQSGKALPRATQLTSGILIFYTTLTLICACSYWLAGMTNFEAVAHAMTTIATGGFSTSDDSIGHFNSITIDYIATFGMFLGALPFILYLKSIQGDWTILLRDSQVRSFVGVLIIFIILVSSWLWVTNQYNMSMALRLASFNIMSIITGTGYVTNDFGSWGSFANPLFFLIMFIGGCAGSTTCGIKVFRFQILYAAARTQIHHLLQPRGVFIPRYNRRPISDEVIFSVLSFFFMWFLTFSALALGLGMLGLDFLTALSSAATAVANVGPGLGSISGPTGTFQTFPEGAKWLLIGGMLLGRLELFTVIILFSRTFWRN